MTISVQELILSEDFLPLELGSIDLILGMQWLRKMGFMGVDWGALTMSFQVGPDKITLKGDPTLTKAEVSLKKLSKTWTESDEAYLVELRQLSIEELREDQEELPPSMSKEVIRLIQDYESIFHLPAGLPPKRGIDHRINIPENQPPVNVRPYK